MTMLLITVLHCNICKLFFTMSLQIIAKVGNTFEFLSAIYLYDVTGSPKCGEIA